MVIPVGINAVSGSELVFTAESVNIPNGLDVILEDRQEGIFTNLSAVGATYAITVSDTMSGAGRFYLHTTTQESLSTVSETLTGVSAFTANRATLRVTGITRGTASLALYNLLGQSVLSTQFEGNLVNDISLPTTLKSGVYVVAIETALGKLNKKIILE
jgi:hypothetical protein